MRIPLIVVDEIPFAMGSTSGPVLLTFNAEGSSQFTCVGDFQISGKVTKAVKCFLLKSEEKN